MEYFWQSEIAYGRDNRPDGSFIRRKALIDGQIVWYDRMDSNLGCGTDHYAREFPDLKFLGEGEIYEINGIKQGRFRNMSYSERYYCVTVADVYGVPFAALTAPQGYEFTGEFRPVKSGETILTVGTNTPTTVYKPNDETKQYPRLILRTLPTVESVYGGQTLEQLKENAKTATWDGDRSLKFEWTGEFRKVQPDEYFLGRMSGCGVNRNDHGLFTGQYRLIMRKCPTIKEIYGKELSELTPPIGYRFTGEFRILRNGDSWMAPGGRACWKALGGDMVNVRLILEELPPTPTIKDVYGTHNPAIPKGWRFKEFRQVTERNVPYLTWSGLNANNMEAPPNPSHWDGWRIVLENDLSTLTYTQTITVEDVYAQIPQVPSGYKVVDFRLPQAGEMLLDVWGEVTTTRSNWIDPSYPRLILSPLGPR